MPLWGTKDTVYSTGNNVTLVNLRICQQANFKELLVRLSMV